MMAGGLGKRKIRTDDKGRVLILGHVHLDYWCCAHPPCHYDMDRYDGRRCPVCGADCITCEIRPDALEEEGII